MCVRFLGKKCRYVWAYALYVRVLVSCLVYVPWPYLLAFVMLLGHV